MKIATFVRMLLVIGAATVSACAAEATEGPNNNAGTGVGATGGAGGAGTGGAAGMTPGGAGGIGGAGGAAGTVAGTGGVGGVGGTGGVGGEVAGAGGIGGAGGMGGSGGSVATGPTISANIEVLQVEPGGQLTVCTTKFLDNATEVKVKNVRGHISGGSHHFIVDRAPTDIPIEGLTPCVGLSGTDATRVLIAEKPETLFAMPEGVGFTLRPNQPLTTELHYFNPTDAPLDIEAIIEFELAEGEEAANMKEASMVFAGTMGIFLPAGMAGEAEYFHLMPGSPSAPIKMFALTSHTHSLGVRATIMRAADDFAPGTMVHESLSWAEPPMTEFAPPMEFTGTDGLRLKCEYMNDREVDVGFGVRVEDEMCFMWLYYY
jgi:hypothetical protein